MAMDDKKKDSASKPAPKPTPAPAAARPTPAPAPAPARTSSTSPSVGQTATRPKAAKTPTSPPRRSDPPRHTSSDTDDVSDARGRSPEPATRATPKPSDAGAHYTRPNEVPLKHGQTIGYSAGKGYYATTRPDPIKASRTPQSSTTKVVARSTRGSTESPIKEHVETRDGKRTVTLSHRSKGSATPKTSGDETHRTRVKVTKASPRVHDQIASAASAKHGTQSPKLNLPGSLAALGIASVLKHGATWKSTKYFVGDFIAETEATASVTGPKVTVNPRTGQVEVTWGKQKLLSTSIDGLAAHGVEVTEQLNAVATEVKDGKPVTKQLTKDATITYAMGVSGPTIKEDVPGGEVSISLNRANQIVIAMQVTVKASAHNSLSDHPVTLGITTTLTPTPVRGQPDKSDPVTAFQPVKEPVQHPSEAHKVLVGFLDVLGFPVHAVLAGGNYLGQHLHPSATPAPAPPWESSDG
jgi:hypothetical protein